MPEGKQISFAQGEYPQLDGLQDGAKVKMEVMATYSPDDNGGGTLTFDKVDLETEGQADRALNSMTQQPAISPTASKGASENF